MSLILASNSPRRRQLLNLTGWGFIVVPVAIDESKKIAEQPEEYVSRMAVEKANAVIELLSGNQFTGDFIIGSDTVVVDWFNPGTIGPHKISAKRAKQRQTERFEILGKPADEKEAELFLRRLRGRMHQVFSAVAVLRLVDHKSFVDTCVTDVPMRHYTDEEMNIYIESGDPLDKAGAYAIQHQEFAPVQNLQGCFANVMGLPICHLVRTLRRAGFTEHKGVPSACQEFLRYNCPVFENILKAR